MALDVIQYLLATTAATLFGFNPATEVSPLAVEIVMADTQLLKGLGRGGEPGGVSTKTKVGKVKSQDLGERGSQGPTADDSKTYSPARRETLDLSQPLPVVPEDGHGKKQDRRAGLTGRHSSSEMEKPRSQNQHDNDLGGVGRHGGSEHGGGDGGGSKGKKSKSAEKEFQTLTPEELAEFRRFYENARQGHPPYADNIHPKYDPLADLGEEAGSKGQVVPPAPAPALAPAPAPAVAPAPMVDTFDKKEPEEALEDASIKSASPASPASREKVADVRPSPQGARSLERAQVSSSPAKLMSAPSTSLKASASSRDTAPQKPSKTSRDKPHSSPFKRGEATLIASINPSAEVIEAARVIGFDLDQGFGGLDEAVQALNKQFAQKDYTLNKQLEDENISESDYREKYSQLMSLVENKQRVKEFLERKFIHTPTKVRQIRGDNLDMKDIMEQALGLFHDEDKTSTELEEELFALKQLRRDLQLEEADAYQDKEGISFNDRPLSEIKEELAELAEDIKGAERRLRLQLAKEKETFEEQSASSPAKPSPISQKIQEAAQREREYFTENHPSLLSFFDLLPAKDQQNLRRAFVRVLYDQESGQQVNAKVGKRAHVEVNRSVVDLLLGMQEPQRNRLHDFLESIEESSRYTAIKEAPNYTRVAQYEFPELPKPQGVQGKEEIDLDAKLKRAARKKEFEEGRKQKLPLRGARHKDFLDDEK